MTKASGYDWLKVLLSITQLEFKYYCYENVKIRTPSLIVYQAHLPAMVCGLTGRELTHGEVRDHFIENEKFPRFLALSNSHYSSWPKLLKVIKILKTTQRLSGSRACTETFGDSAGAPPAWASGGHQQISAEAEKYMEIFQLR